MELGQRIKSARLEAGMSQRQLCGETITRNMLSLIESGKARPSMDTLAYLAGRLGKTMGYFLEEQAVASPNTAVMETARSAYAGGDPAGALAALEGYAAPDALFDPERWLLESLCLTDRAEQVLREGKNAYAIALLEKAEAAAARTVYDSPVARRRRVLLAGSAEPMQAERLVALLPEVSPELILRARAALGQDDFSRAAAILEAAEVRDGQWYLLRGQAAAGLEEYAAGAEFLCRAEEAFTRECAPLLELCYREMGDYKRAYEYACKQR